MESIKYCDICSKRYAEDTHHTHSGVDRKHCDKYPEMLLHVCRECHNDIHANPTAARLSKMYGQAMFELNHTRQEYLKQFKQNYLPL